MKKLSSLSQKSGFLSSEITKFKGVRLKSIQRLHPNLNFCSQRLK